MRALERRARRLLALLRARGAGREARPSRLFLGRRQHPRRVRGSLSGTREPTTRAAGLPSAPRRWHAIRPALLAGLECRGRWGCVDACATPPSWDGEPRRSLTVPPAPLGGSRAGVRHEHDCCEDGWEHRCDGFRFANASTPHSPRVRPPAHLPARPTPFSAVISTAIWANTALRISSACLAHSHDLCCRRWSACRWSNRAEPKSTPHTLHTVALPTRRGASPPALRSRPPRLSTPLALPSESTAPRRRSLSAPAPLRCNPGPPTPGSSSAPPAPRSLSALPPLRCISAPPTSRSNSVGRTGTNHACGVASALRRNCRATAPHSALATGGGSPTPCSSAGVRRAADPSE
eukprot:scaffold829_cov101-Isochrysis_galbana.AAC.2